MPRPELSLVIPIYNEEEVLPQLDVRLKELLARLAMDTEVVFVNDGSRDRSLDILRGLAAAEERYRVLGFSRNFGHQRAITAGMEKSRGKAVVVMDADLQDPPEVILEMVAKWREGFDVVYGRRRSRQGESFFKLVTAKLFYRLFAALIPIEVPLDAGDFRLMSRRVVRTMSGLRETHRFIRGLVSWVGFKQTAVEYDRAARAAGETKYPLRKMLAFALDGIASFSIQPLRFATYVGALVGTASVLYAIVSTVTWYRGHTVQGWTTTVVLVSMLFSVQFFMIGVLGEYVGRIYEQAKRRPLYIIAERINFGRKRARVSGDETVRAPDVAPPARFEATTRPDTPQKMAAKVDAAAKTEPSPKREASPKTEPSPQRASVPPFAARTPSAPPARAAFPSVPPTRAAAPSVPPLRAAAPSVAPLRAAAPSVPPLRAAAPSVPPVRAAALSSSDSPPSRRSVTPAPPTTGTKPPPLKLTSSLTSLPEPRASVPRGSEPPQRRSVPPALPRPPSPTVPPPISARMPSAPPVGLRTPSTPPVGLRTPSTPPVAQTPSVPRVRTTSVQPPRPTPPPLPPTTPTSPPPAVDAKKPSIAPAPIEAAVPPTSDDT